MTSLTVVLPLPPNMANSRMHWRVKERKRKDYFASCALRWYAQASGGPLSRSRARMSQEPRKAHLAFEMIVGNEMDEDNALARCKWAVDFLVREGILYGDKPKDCAMSIPKQIVKRTKDSYTLRVTITYDDATDPETGMIATDLDYGAKP